MENVLGADLANMHLKANLIKKFIFYYVLLKFSVNPYGLFILKIKMVLQLLMVFKKL